MAAAMSTSEHKSYVAITDATGRFQVRHHGGPQCNLYQRSPMGDDAWTETNVGSRAEWWQGYKHYPNRSEVEDFAAELFTEQYEAQRGDDSGPFDG